VSRQTVLSASLLCSALSTLVLGAGGVAAASARATGACGLPDAKPLWIDYAEGSVPANVRAVFARPGVVVTTSGGPVPAGLRSRGAATTYFVLHLPTLVGDPAQPADPASIEPAARALLARAATSTGCATPWIALNELFGESSPTPWSPTTAQYRADVLALVQALAAHGAVPVLLVHGNPNLAGDAMVWWHQIAQAGMIVYEAYYDAAHISSLGPLMGNRRMRLGIRSFVSSFGAVGITPDRLGVMLGFHVGRIPNSGGRQGLQPTQAWLRVVKWEAVGAREVAQETGLSSIWSWGWGTFGPDSADPDKPAAACVYLWARDHTLCDGPAAAGVGFDTSLAEAQIVVPPGVYCTLADHHVLTADVRRLTRLTRDRHAALTALFARAALGSAARVTEAQVLAAEQRAVVLRFGGDRRAYLRALTARHATLGIARGIIRDELRRRALSASIAAGGSGQTTLEWEADREAAAANTAICRGDDLPGTGNFPVTDARDVGVVQLPSLLPFLFGDRAAPAAPAAPTATAGPQGITLSWQPGPEADLAGYVVERAAGVGGPFLPISGPLDDPTFVDVQPSVGAPPLYEIVAVDTSGNASLPSASMTPTPAPGG
jgi:hypothetical protein